MKRRGFLGFMGGAAAAGPSVAKAAVAEMPKGLGAAFSHNPGAPLGGLSQGIRDTASSIGGSWRIKEIASLRRVLLGDLTDEEKEQRKRSRLYAHQSVVQQNIAGLVSVSGVRKMEMYGDQMARLDDRIRRSEAQGYLSRLLREEADDR